MSRLGGRWLQEQAEQSRERKRSKNRGKKERKKRNKRRRKLEAFEQREAQRQEARALFAQSYPARGACKTQQALSLVNG